MTEELCRICEKKEPDVEGVVCSPCKTEVDERDAKDELETYEQDMLSSNHRGEICWLDASFCHIGDCRRCQVYNNWKEGCHGD